LSKLAFLGLGQMGTPMAVRLLEAGHHLTVWNRTPQKTGPLVALGASAASSPAEAAGGADAAITMLATPEALEDVLFGPEGLAAALAPGQMLIEMSTVGPDVIRSMRSRMRDGVGVVDAPVRGSISEAADGSLIILLGGTDDLVPRARGILEPLGTVHHVGGPGAGASMKLVANSTLGAVITALGEALSLGEALGLDRGAVLDVLADSPIGSTARSKRSSVESGTYPPRFKLSLALKDLRLVIEAANGVDRDLKVATACRQWFEQALDAGGGDLDYSAVVATILEDRRSGPRPT
jgi:3-hydroxyisobutyrate dehydrogenase-like beta-hydroxyacid dehydrogenase